MTDRTFDLTGKRVWVAGHRGLVGSALVRRLQDEALTELITATSDDVDLRRQDQTEQFVGDTRPDVVLSAAAKVGGIHANRMSQGEFLYDNLMIGHVLPALLRKIHEAEQSGQATMVVSGTGEPRRKFLHVDDLADATIYATEQYEDEEHLNVGAGEDISIREPAQLIADVVGWDGRFAYDTSMPDGTPRKLLDITRLRELGWKPPIGLREGIADVHDWYKERLVR